MSLYCERVKNSVCLTYFPSRKNLKIILFFFHDEEHEKCHIKHVSRDQSIESVWMFNTKQTCFPLIFITVLFGFQTVICAVHIGQPNTTFQHNLFAFFRKLCVISNATEFRNEMNKTNICTIHKENE